MKDFFTKISKQVLFFDICVFWEKKIELEVVPVWVGHSVYEYAGSIGYFDILVDKLGVSKNKIKSQKLLVYFNNLAV